MNEGYRFVEIAGSSIKERSASYWFLLPGFELLSPRGAYNLLFTRRTRVFELYVRELAVACGFPMHQYIMPFYFSRKKDLGHVPFIASRAAH